MIAYLKGKITFKKPTYIYVECGGVGYHVNISLNTYQAIEDKEDIKILTYLQVKEDSQALYGFYDERERNLFVLLISVSGVGVNTARVMLSGMSVDDMRSAIIHEQVATLNKIKGIGPKTAKRIILDLKDKVLKDGAVADSLSPSISNTMADEALSAMIALGFPRNTVNKQLNAIMANQTNITQVEDLIKAALKQLS
ncbi:Holliday junction branch migration protein RuvA [Saprospiraceae bacterium]|nr:Holliday junction branch migration protein RuvA [Saprospiraceae bacterium]HAI57570.1 Holliday junction branch migration protein RuvA [Saprospirales bacterium]MDA9182342.1 Holliday junction branch migration protein RuvA [Saprospiraceae bacterium]MDA9263478.1 Holliday junction branch migration protein RuvA [Saprospiraceae bacterium]MDA9299263.1 Holliday junction branch migration protein RuvA [Saprospiraceae bacterium]